MTPAALATYVRHITGDTTAEQLSDAKLLALVNVAKDEIARRVIKANEDLFGLPMLRNLEAGRREYALPSDIMQVKAVEAKLDGVAWSRLDEFDLNTYRRTTDEASIVLEWSGRSPRFDIFRNSLWLYTGASIVDVTDGLKLYAIVWPADIASLSGTTDMSVDPSTITHGMPRQVHELIGRRASILYKSSADRQIPLSERELSYRADLDEAIESIRGFNLDRATEASVPADTGEDY